MSDKPAVTIRSEDPADEAAIRAILIDVFSDMEYSQQTEHLIVDELRRSGKLSLSLVAERGGRVVGHIAFSPGTIGEETEGWFVLGPLAVARDAQGQVWRVRWSRLASPHSVRAVHAERFWWATRRSTGDSASSAIRTSYGPACPTSTFSSWSWRGKGRRVKSGATRRS